MTPRATLLLVLLAIGVGAGAWYFGLRPAAEQSAEPAGGGSLAFPDLASRLAAARRIEITHDKTTLVLNRAGDGWGLADHDGFPAQTEKVRELLTGLTELRFVEPRTSDPAQFSRLGVDDPAAPGASATLLRLLDGSGAPIAELIVGHRRVRTGGDLPESVYVRRPGATQAWLAEGRVAPDSDWQSWIARDIVSIPAKRVASVTVAREGAPPLEFGREGEAAVLKAPSEHPKLDPGKVDDVFGALENLTLVDVRPAAKNPGRTTPGVDEGTRITKTTDGETLVATVFRVAKQPEPEIWIELTASGEGASKAEAEATQARATGWAFQVGAWKEHAMLPSMDDLKAESPDAPPTAPAASTLAAPATGGTAGAPPRAAPSK